MKYWEIIADNLSKAGWSWGCVSAVDSNGQTIWIADAHRDDGKRFVVRADEKLTAFVELESAIGGGQLPVLPCPRLALAYCSARFPAHSAALVPAPGCSHGNESEDHCLDDFNRLKAALRSMAVLAPVVRLSNYSTHHKPQ
jgi:hypothetical protein